MTMIIKDKVRSLRQQLAVANQQTWIITMGKILVHAKDPRIQGS